MTDIAENINAAPAVIGLERPRVLDDAPALQPSRARTGHLTRMLGLVTLYLSWGSTYPAMRVALRALPPFTLLSARCLIAGVVLFVVALARGGRLPSARSWLASLAVGALVLGVGHGLMTWALQEVTGGLAAILASMVSLWLPAFAFGMLGERPGRRTLIGLGIGLFGLSVVVGTLAGGVTPLLPLVALVLSPVAWAFGSVLSCRLRLPDEPIMATATQLLTCAPLMALAALVRGESLDVTTIDRTSLLAFLYVTVAGYVIGFSVYNWLLRSLPLSTVGTYAFVNPIVAIALGTLLLSEPLHLDSVIGGTVILAGVALVVLDGGRRSARSEEFAGASRSVL